MKKRVLHPQAQVVDFASAAARYDYKTLLRGYQEVYEGKLVELKNEHLDDVNSFAQVLQEAWDLMAEVNAEQGWSQASEADLREMEKVCVELDDMLKAYVPFFDRRKIVDMGQRILQAEHLGKNKKDAQLIEGFEEARQRRAAGFR